MTRISPLERHALTGTAVASVPQGQSAPFDWPVIRLDATPTPWHVEPSHRSARGRCQFRLAVGIDIRRAVQIHIQQAGASRPVATMDVSFATALQHVTADLAFDKSSVTQSSAGTWTLQTSDGEPVYVLAPSVPHQAFRPHLLTGGSPGNVQAFLSHLQSTASLTQFGWMEGCVLDALADLGDTATLDTHLDQYFTSTGVIYENFRSVRLNHIQGTETTNMFAGLARRRPDHPAVDRVLAFFKNRQHPDGTIRDGNTVAEHNLTVAYPLAVIGAARGREDLCDQAVTQLRIRRDRLDTTDGLYLRCDAHGMLTFLDWARGVTWYLLGLVRTLRVLDAAGHRLPDELIDDLPGHATRLLDLQDQSGLWTCFVREPATGLEVSGSAGIAAALALAEQRGWLASEAGAAARRAAEGIGPYIQPDGLLAGMSPANKAEAGPDVQRSGQRVMGGAATGLFGQLLASLRMENL